MSSDTPNAPRIFPRGTDHTDEEHPHVVADAQFKPEWERWDDGDMSLEELVHLAEDERYQRLTELRYKADQLEREVAADDDSPAGTRGGLFDAVQKRDAPLREAVDEYVDEWLANRRAETMEAER